MPNKEENIKRFINASEKAKKLIQMDARGEINKYRDKSISENKIDYEAINSNKDIEYLTELPSNATSYSNNSQQIKNTNLPPEILESMTNNKIDTSLMGVSVGTTSVLDQLNVATKGKLLNNKPSNKIINEQTQPSQSNSIDYSLVKTIVEDCIKRYSSAIRKTIINENKSISNNDNTIQALKLGNKFSFITKNGDLYEANLKFIKNVNK